MSICCLARRFRLSFGEIDCFDCFVVDYRIQMMRNQKKNTQSIYFGCVNLENEVATGELCTVVEFFSVLLLLLLR